MLFIDNKYTRWYYAIVEKAQKRASTKKQAKELLGYVEQHHIIPECFYIVRVRKGKPGWLTGNCNLAENLVFLTAKEHYLCHQLLVRMTSGRSLFLMQAALNLMSNKTRSKYKVTSWQYEYAVSGRSAAMKKLWANPEFYQKSCQQKKDLWKNKEWVAKHPTKNANFLNKTHSDETKLKISRANKGRKFTEEHKNNLKKAAQFRPSRSEESRKKTSLALKGRPLSEAHKEKLNEIRNKPEYRELVSKQFKGKPKSQEQKEKISKATTGRKLSPEIIAKRAETKRIKRLLENEANLK